MRRGGDSSRLALVAVLLFGGFVAVGRAEAAGRSATMMRSSIAPMSAPAVEVSPGTGALNGGTAVTVTVSAGLPSNPIVLFGGVSATSVVTTSATVLTAVTPASATFAAGGVLVEVGDGSTTQSATAFSYTGTPAYRVFANDRLRFGTGTEESIQPTGVSDRAAGSLRQPFYKGSDGNFYKLTYQDYPLDLAIGSGTNGPNWTGNTVLVIPDLSTGFAIDYSDFIPSGFVDPASSTAIRGFGVVSTSGQVTLNGVSVRVTQQYELSTSTSAFVKITTTVTNLDGTSPLPNAHAWVGTRDDYVRNTDRPIKEKGNLVGGAFVSISATSDRSSALRIRTDDEGVLFYSTTQNSDISVRGCCNFGTAVNGNPTGSAIVTGVNVGDHDGSYALSVPFGDLAPGQSGSVIWFYAAGPIAELSNVVNEVSQAAPTTTTTTTTTTAAPPVTAPTCCPVVPVTSNAPSSSPPVTTGPPSSAPEQTVRATVPGSSVPAAPVTQVAGSLPSVPVGQSVVTQNGQPIPVTVQQTSPGAWQLNGNGFQMALQVPLPAGGAPAGGGEITLVQNRTVDVSGNGFRAGSLVDVWLFSTPRLLGTVRVNADGTFSGTLNLPAGVPAGSHTLQANGVTPDSQVRSLNLGVRVVATNPRLPVTGDEPTPALRWALFITALGALGWSVPRLRRRVKSV